MESVRPSGILDKVHLPLELVVNEVRIGGWGLLLLREPRGPEWHEEVLVEDWVPALVLPWEPQSIGGSSDLLHDWEQTHASVVELLHRPVGGYVGLLHPDQVPLLVVDRSPSVPVVVPLHEVPCLGQCRPRFLARLAHGGDQGVHRDIPGGSSGCHTVVGVMATVHEERGVSQRCLDLVVVRELGQGEPL